MSLMSIGEYTKIVKESNFNIAEIFSQAPNETLLIVLILVAIFLVMFYYIQRNIKIKETLKLIDTLQDVKDYEEYNEKITKLVQELPKRGIKVAELLNSTKDHILFRVSKLLIDFSIEEKIEKYLDISNKFKELSDGSKKYGNKDLTSFYEQKSKELLEVNLFDEIVYYAQNVHFDEDEVSNVNAIVKYANSTNNPTPIIDNIIESLNKFSFAYNLDLYKFTNKLTQKDSNQIFKYCTEKFDKIFTSKKDEISIIILEYIHEFEDKQKLYDYISTLENSVYLQQLHDQLFDKKDDLDLDLAFIANPTKIENKYKEYIDDSLTSNWRDGEHIEYVSKAPGVLEVLGHIEFRLLIERIDNIAINEENKKKIDEALTIAKRAETIALEAKSLNKIPVNTNTTKSEE